MHRRTAARPASAFASLPIILPLLLATLACGPAASQSAGAGPLPDCEWCGTGEAPQELSWQTTIAGPDEPGERMVISGTVYEPDGETPAEGVILYLYHTNREGIYPKRGDETGNARRHGYLRSWLRTDERGRYRFSTIRPAQYPTDNAPPAHVHVTVEEPGREEYWLDSFEFSDDPKVTPEYRASKPKRGGSGIIELRWEEGGEGEEGVWIGERNIVLIEE